MKQKHLLGIAFAALVGGFLALVGGFLAYQLLKKKKMVTQPRFLMIMRGMLYQR